MSDDAALIEHLGGPARVAELLGYDKSGGVQRVHNWRARGIPPRVKLQFPEIFLRRPDDVVGPAPVPQAGEAARPCEQPAPDSVALTEVAE